MTNYFADDFNTYDRDDWMTSTWSSKGSTWLYTSWNEDKVDHNANDGTVTLTLSDENDRAKDYSGAEIQTRDFYGFGVFEVTMRASGADGVNSNFFIYSGEVHGNVKNEIDFEFLGKDPTKVWTSYHSPVANGFGKNGPVGQRGEWVDLGFDSSKGMHTYRIEWLPDSIRWYADGKLLRVVEAPEGMTGADIGIPEHPGKMYMNIWAGVPQWLGETDPGFKQTSATYDNVKYMSWDHPDAVSLGDGVSSDAPAPVKPPIQPEPEEVDPPEAAPTPPVQEEQPPAPAPDPQPEPEPEAEPVELINPSTGQYPTFDWNGTSGHNDITGTNRSDAISGGGGNDRISGRDANDVLSGGAGNDRVWGNSGNDELVYIAEINEGATDVYIGSIGNDLLTLYLTEEIAARPAVIADIVAFQQFLTTNTNTNTYGGNQFVFESLGLTVKAIERIDVIIEGSETAADDLLNALEDTPVAEAPVVPAPVAPVEDPAPVAEPPAAEPVDSNVGKLPDFDAAGSANADVFRGNGSSENYTGGRGSDTIISRGGNDMVAGGAGNDVVRAGAGNDELIYIAADNNGARDVYQGATGNDKLSIYMTQEEVDASNIGADIAAFEAFAAQNYDLGRTGGNSYTFNSFNLEVQSVEEIELVIYDTL